MADRCNVPSTTHLLINLKSHNRWQNSNYRVSECIDYRNIHKIWKREGGGGGWRRARYEYMKCEYMIDCLFVRIIPCKLGFAICSAVSVHTSNQSDCARWRIATGRFKCFFNSPTGLWQNKEKKQTEKNEGECFFNFTSLECIFVPSDYSEFNGI